MALSIFKATAIYRNARWTFNDADNTIDLNGAELDAFAPRDAWVLRYLVPGQNQVQYLLTFQPSSEQLADANTVQGLYIEQDGKGVVIDCISIDNFNTVANGNASNLQRRYGAAPAFTNPTPLWYCVTRSDDGSGYSHDQVVMDYIGQYFGNVRLKSNVSGVSIYTFQAYGTPKAIGSDVVAQC